MNKCCYVLKNHTGFNHFMCNLAFGFEHMTKKHGVETEKNLIIESNSWQNFDEFFITKNFKIIKSSTEVTGVIPIIGGWLKSKFNWSEFLVENIELKPFVKNKIREFINILGKDYTAIHCRFGDRYKDFKEIDLYVDRISDCIKYAEKTNTNILLCCDDTAFIDQYKNKKNIFNFSVFKELSNLRGKSLHTCNNETIKKETGLINKYVFNLSTIIDFYLMILSKKLIVCSNGNYSRAANAIKLYLEYKNLDPSRALL